MKKLYKMENKIQKYEWGTFDYIASLLQLENNSAEPWAELWMSAHDKAPSFLPEIRSNLNTAIANNPQEFLGEKVAKNYKNKLPYLFKILSANKPLSIQAHPNLEQAKRGFKLENEQGILLTDFIRNYKDDNHKPELICALTEFHAMCGFRPASEIINFFNQLGLNKVLREFSAFEKEAKADNWEKVFIEIIAGSVEKKLQIVELVINNIHDLNDEFVKDWVLKMMIHYPNDIGIISPLFLNTFILQAGEAVFLKAGILHAYLQGTGVEIMANSDNVLRGGLTPKNIDVKELVSILEWEMKEPEIQSYNFNSQVISYQIPINEFSLKRVKLTGELKIKNEKPTMIIVVEGETQVTCGEEFKKVKKGETIFVTSEAKEFTLAGQALLFVASTNDNY